MGLADFINRVQPPFRLEESASQPVRDLLTEIGRLFAEANAERRLGVSVALDPGRSG